MVRASLEPDCSMEAMHRRPLSSWSATFRKRSWAWDSVSCERERTWKAEALLCWMAEQLLLVACPAGALSRRSDNRRRTPPMLVLWHSGPCTPTEVATHFQAPRCGGPLCPVRDSDSGLAPPSCQRPGVKAHICRVALRAQGLTRGRAMAEVKLPSLATWDHWSSNASRGTRTPVQHASSPRALI